MGSILDPKPLTLAAGNATYAGLATTPSSINRWKSKLATDAANAKILLIGDSTSDPATDAGAILTQLKTLHTLPTEGLEGMNPANITSQGRNGSKLSEWMATTAWTDAVVAAAPDLIVFSLGINDVRLGTVDGPTLKANIISYINTLRGRLPSADFVLRTPNSFLSDDPGATGWLTPLSSSQAYSKLLLDVYGSLANQWPNAVVWNSQDRIFGRTSRTLAEAQGLMKDILHPSKLKGYPLIADYLVQDVIGHSRKALYSNPRPVDMAQASRPANPYILGDMQDRADSATSLGNASSGQAWTAFAGTLGIQSKRIYAPAAASNGATIDVGTNYFEAGVTFTNHDTSGSNDQFFFFRIGSGVANSLGIRSYNKQRWELVRWVGGAVTVLSFDADIIPANGDRVRVINEKSKYKVFINDRLLFLGDETAHQDLTKIGLHTSTTGTRWADVWARQLPVT